LFAIKNFQLQKLRLDIKIFSEVKKILKFKSSLIIMIVFMLFYANFSVFAAITAEEREMFNLVNSARIERGLQPYTIDSELAELARLKAEDMVNLGYFAHHSPTYGSPFEMMKNFGINYNSAGENIAENRTIAGAHLALMLSDSHKANLLSQRFSRIGIGIVNGPREFKTIVQMFIEPISQPAK